MLTNEDKIFIDSVNVSKFNNLTDQYWAIWIKCNNYLEKQYEKVDMRIRKAKHKELIYHLQVKFAKRNK